MGNLSKVLVAEFIGTFALVFLGAGAGVMLGIPDTPAGLVTVALAHGLTLMVFIFAFGHISGTHVNPAVTLAVWAAGKMEASKAGAYIVTQLVAGIVAAFVLKFVLGAAGGTLGATVINFDLTTVAGAFVLELIGAFFLANTVLNAAVSGRAGNLAGVAVGMTLAACIMFFGPVTGASLNPARTLGPAVAAGVYTDIWVYLVATALGGVLAGLLYRYFLEEAAAPAAAAPPAAAIDASAAVAARPRPAGRRRR
jgi:MIP family channel proteins